MKTDEAIYSTLHLCKQKRRRYVSAKMKNLNFLCTAVEKIQGLDNLVQPILLKMLAKAIL